MSEVSAPWLHATLADAAESLAAALEKLEAHMDWETADELLRRDLVEVYAKLNYAKLNYAVNTAHLGSDALSILSEDELMAWPADMPFATVEELEAEAAEAQEEAGEEEGAHA